MAWTTPTVRATSDLITASIWNTDIVDNLKYLKGQSGTISLEGDPVPSASTKKVGTSALPWGAGHFYALYAGPRYAVHQSVRQVDIIWANKDIGEEQIDTHESVANSSIAADGSGQAVLIVDDNASAYVYTVLDAEVDGLDNDFNGSRSPYYRQEFAINQSVANSTVFLGLRQTPGEDLPNYAAENFFALEWTGAIWIFHTGNGTDQDVSNTQSINENTRYVIELFVIAGVGVECWLNGVLIDTLTVIPTGALKWSVLLESDGGGGATQSKLTIGKSVLQEDLS